MLLLWMLLGCHCASTSRTTRPSGAREVAPAPAEPSAPLSSHHESERLHIGFEQAPRATTAEEDAQNSRALRLLREGNAAGAETVLRRLVEANDTHVLFRFNHACALARLGRLDEAGRELRILLAMDLPTIESRYREDADLEALRQSEHAAGLSGHIDALRQRFLDARGVAVIAYDTATWIDDAAPVRERDVVYTQAGILDEATGRFVPRAPRFADALMSFYDAELGTALVITGRADSDGIGHVRRQAVHAYWPGTGRVESLRLEDEGSVGLVRSDDDILVGWPGSLATARLDGTQWRRVGDMEDPVSIPSRVRWSRLVSYGGPVVSTEGELPGEIRGNRLVMGERAVELGSGHAASDRRSIAATDDTVWVASVRGPCRDGLPFQRHFAERVHRASGAVQRISEADSIAHVRAGPDGIYLQLGTSLRHYPDPASDAWAPVPEGLLLIEPYSSGCDA